MHGYRQFHVLRSKDVHPRRLAPSAAVDNNAVDSKLEHIHKGPFVDHTISVSQY